jgi:alkylhydroperoxidase/carboxymuconolactone decarboxylase family protein YurZ
MLTDSVKALLHAATFASRPELRSELNELLHTIKRDTLATFDELYEVFLQTYLFVGFPAALESVRLLDRVFGVHKQIPEIDSDSVIKEYTDFVTKGEALYQKVYASNAARVREEMLRLSPELAAWALIEGYGKTLSRNGLDTKIRELCTVAQLTQLRWERQLFSHILGAKNVGAGIEEIREAVLIGSFGDKEILDHAEQLVSKIV